jgi:hypothetical protein
MSHAAIALAPQEGKIEPRITSILDGWDGDRYLRVLPDIYLNYKHYQGSDGIEEPRSVHFGGDDYLGPSLNGAGC